ncbi:MAG: thioesterase family protein [Gammaproteobacteria bacterium]
MHPEEAEDFLHEYPVTVEVPVAWGEMDSFQHVNNIVYFRYFESARIACFDRIGYSDLARDSGCGPILASTECRFLIPLTYPDKLIAGTVIRDIGQHHFHMDYAVFSRNHDAIAAAGSGRIVSYDYQRQEKTPVPDAIRKALEALRRRA